MNPLVYHIAGGGAFFTGVALLLTSMSLTWCAHHWLRRGAPLLFCIGAIAITISSTPLPYWLLAAAVVVTIGWFVSLRFDQRKRMASAVFALVWCLAALWEASYWQLPQVAPAPARAITIIGDSVTAGLGAQSEVTWPQLFAQQHNIAVQDLSGPGFTTSQALARAQFEGIDAPLVLVEIGGNDMLQWRSSRTFHNDLEALLNVLAQDGRQVVMLELPLIPTFGNYGRAQRSLASKYGVLLVPKRVFLNMIAPQEATVDTIHLTQQGHRAMSDEVWRILSPAYSAAVD